jgi:dTDP-glucose pyrophosphorylase
MDKEHIIHKNQTVLTVLKRLDELASNAILFVVNNDQILLGSISDGDIRRGLIKGLNLENELLDFVQENPKYFTSKDYNFNEMVNWREHNYRIIPVINSNKQIVDIINFSQQRSYLPVDAVIMAGGKGTRLLPLTQDTPKPLLMVGEKPIVEYNIDRLKLYGIRNITLSIKYLGEQIKKYFKNGEAKQLTIDYIKEDQPLGTIGAVSLKDSFVHDYILVMNSDILTNIDFEDMFKVFVEKDADMAVATTPYEVDIPYGVIETNNDQIIGLKEKPTYTYYSNAGIYLIKKTALNNIPKGEHFNATDLMEKLYTSGKTVTHYPILGYWLDIGKPHDYKKAQQDIEHIKF